MGYLTAIIKKTIAEKKLELLSKCTKAITSCSKKSDEIPDGRRLTFGLYL